MSAALTREEWLDAHGSERLRRCVAEGIECEAIYRDERLALERPGWRYVDPNSIQVARNPPLAAFALLDAARAVESTAVLRYIPAVFSVEGFGVAGRFGTYVAIAEHAGRPIVYARPAPAPASEPAR